MRVVFRKTGKDIKRAVENRRVQLQQRLDSRNAVLDEFMKDTKKVRSYLVRSTEQFWGGHGARPAVLYSKDDISSEEKEEIAQLCRRIFELEQELNRLLMLTHHLENDQIFELSLEELIGYGFEAEMSSE